MAREAALWVWMHDHGKGMPRLDMRRVENLLTRGTPDVDLCHDSHQAWVELKGANRPVHATSLLKYDLTTLQAMWLERRWKTGGSSWVYFRVGIGRDVRRYLVPGVAASALVACVPEFTLNALSVIPPDHSFDEFLLALRKRPDATS